MKIREATIDDVGEIVGMVGDFMEGTRYGQLMPFDPGYIAQLCVRVLSMGVIFVAEVKEKPATREGRILYPERLVGMLAIVALPHPLTGLQYGDELAWWVDPAYRNTTIGPRLLRAGMAWACNKKLHVLKMVSPAGSRVGDYYKRLGFEEIETAYSVRL